MAPGSTFPESINKEECHQGSAGARFYSWKVLLLRVRGIFLWTVVLPFCIHATIATNTSAHCRHYHAEVARQYEADMSRKSVPHQEETGELGTQRPASYRLYIYNLYSYMCL